MGIQKLKGIAMVDMCIYNYAGARSAQGQVQTYSYIVRVSVLLQHSKNLPKLSGNALPLLII